MLSRGGVGGGGGGRGKGKGKGGGKGERGKGGGEDLDFTAGWRLNGGDWMGEGEKGVGYRKG